MRVFVLGADAGQSLGFGIALRLVARGHRVTVSTRFDSKERFSGYGIEAAEGDIEGAAFQARLAISDAIIDAELPFTFSIKRVRLSGLRPSILLRALEGSGKTLIVSTGCNENAQPAPSENESLLESAYERNGEEIDDFSVPFYAPFLC